MAFKGPICDCISAIVYIGVIWAIYKTIVHLSTRWHVEPKPEHQCSIITHLPNELLREIYQHLDLYSLRSLLWAYPELIKHFVVVSDMPMKYELVPSFFTLPGIKIVRMAEYHPLKHRRGTTMIALFEFCGQLDDKETRMELQLDPEEVSYPFFGKLQTHIDKYSFVYVQSASFCCNRARTHMLFTAEESSKAGKMLLDADPGVGQGYGYCGFPFWPNGLKTRTVNEFYRYNKIQINNVTWIRIHGVHNVENLILENVKMLWIHFDTHSNGERPSLVNLTAERAAKFTVNYRDQFPFIKGVNAGSLVSKRGVIERRLSISQTDALEALYNPLPACKTSIEDMKEVDLSFSRNYTSVLVIGGHDIILSLVDFSNIKQLGWKQTNNQVDQLKSIPNVSKVVHFTFETILPKARLPLLKLSPYVKTFAIISRADQLDLNGALTLNKFRKTEHLIITDFSLVKPGHEKSTLKVPASVLTKFTKPVSVILRGVAIDQELRRDRMPSRWIENLSLSDMRGPFACVDTNDVNVRFSPRALEVMEEKRKQEEWQRRKLIYPNIPRYVYGQSK